MESKEDEYKRRIQTYDWTNLARFWRIIKAKKTRLLGWSDGKALEYFILRAFELENAEVRYPYNVPIDSLELGENENALEQIDGVIYSNEIACLIECKDFTNKVNFESIAKLRSQLMRRPSATIASIFSVSGFTQPALILLGFIHPQTILAWESDDIEFSLTNKKFRDSLKQKYRKAIEEADYNFRLEED